MFVGRPEVGRAIVSLVATTFEKSDVENAKLLQPLQLQKSMCKAAILSRCSNCEKTHETSLLPTFSFFCGDARLDRGFVQHKYSTGFVCCDFVERFSSNDGIAIALMADSERILSVFLTPVLSTKRVRPWNPPIVAPF